MATPKIGDPLLPNPSNMPKTSSVSFSFLNSSVDLVNDFKDRALYAGLLKKRIY